MRERIKEIMESENLTPSAFADKLNIGRAVLSHILTGRNNASIDVITRILESIDKISPDWLLLGRGSMYKDGDTTPKPTINAGGYQSSIFDQLDQGSLQANVVDSPPKEEMNTTVDAPSVSVNHQTVISKPSKEIRKIIIYYTDNTFQVFNPDQATF